VYITIIEALRYRPFIKRNVRYYEMQKVIEFTEQFVSSLFFMFFIFTLLFVCI